MQLLSLAAKYRKYIVTLFPRRSTTVYKIRKLYITIISTFYNVENKLHNFTKSRKLFPTVLKLFSNLRVCLIGKWSIAPLHDAETSFQRLFFSMLEFKSLQHIFFCMQICHQHQIRVPYFFTSHLHTFNTSCMVRYLLFTGCEGSFNDPSVQRRSRRYRLFRYYNMLVVGDQFRKSV